MRKPFTVALALGLAACDSSETSGKSPIEAVPASFEGADAATAEERIKHGERLSWILGCRGCHGKTLDGKMFDNDPKGYGLLWASNLTRSVPKMSDAQMDDVMRRGVHPSRPKLWLMPSENFQHLSDPDLAALMAYLRALPATGEPSPPPVLGPKAIAEVASGEVKPAADLVRETRDILPVDLGKGHEFGRYAAAVTCAECHGPELAGRSGGPPDLIVAGAYSREEFERLITQGDAPRGRKLNPLMEGVARTRYSRLTPGERDALYSYLKARAERPQ